MPKDKRLWMTFPIDFPDHPKIRPLSDAAFRAFVEMNGYSRTQDLDGRIPVRVARAKWKPKALKELETNHPERPTLSVDGDDYVIWNYDEHQQTRAAREAKSETNSQNGAKGGRPRKNRTETDSVSARKRTRTEREAESESESETDLTDVTYLPESGHVGDRARSRTDLSEEIISEAKHAGVDDLGAVLDLLEPIVGELNPRHGVELAQVILRRARTAVLQPTAYIARACEKRDEIRRIAVDVLDLPGVA